MKPKALRISENDQWGTGIISKRPARLSVRPDIRSSWDDPSKTELLAEGCRFFFFSNEGTEPPHIHVERGDGYAKFWLEPVELVDAVGMKTRELGRARLLVIQHRIDFREKWREYFGT